MSHYDVFISASSKDYAIAGEVYRFLRDHKLEVFFSEQSLRQRGSSDYRKVIDEAIEHTTHMVVVTSSRANVEGEWVQAEWGSFISEKRSGRKNGNLVTVLVGGLPLEELPLSLRNLEVLRYNDEDLIKLLSYVAAGAVPIKKPSTGKRRQGKAAVWGAAVLLLLAVGSVVGWNVFYKPGTTGSTIAPPASQEVPISPPAASRPTNPSPAATPLAKLPAAPEQPKQEIVEKKQEPATAKTEPPAPVQTAPSAPPAPAATAPPLQPANPPPSSSAATSRATVLVFINNPGINDRFVDKLLDQLRSGLSQKEQEAPASSAANYVLRWLEKPMFQRQGPNRDGEYTFSISMRCEVYSQANARVVKTIPVHEQQTGRNEQAANILSGLIAKSSAEILGELATLEQ